MVPPQRRRRATQLWMKRLDRKARDADLRVRCRVLLKVHAGQSPHRAATARVEQLLRQMGAKIRLHFLPPEEGYAHAA